MSVCTWCHDSHATPLQLCPVCEEMAQRLRSRSGEPIRATKEST